MKRAGRKPALKKRNRAASTLPATPRECSVSGISAAGFHRLAYVDWGPANDDTPVVCVHGVTRQARDFDFLANTLTTMGRRVICPDLPGRGRSDRLSNADDYALPQYCADINTVIARTGAQAVDYVGTSLGGLIGMILAGMAGTTIRRLVINDIGPYVSSTGLSRIGAYLRELPASFTTLEKARAYFRSVLEPYGDLTEEQWHHLTVHSVEWNPVRYNYQMRCDRAIAKGFRAAWFTSLNLWQYWEAIEVPILILHGAKSDLLTYDLCNDMIERNPNATLHRFHDCGHVPPLMTANQVDVVTNFLTRDMNPGKEAG